MMKENRINFGSNFSYLEVVAKSKITANYWFRIKYFFIGWILYQWSLNLGDSKECAENMNVLYRQLVVSPLFVYNYKF